MESTDLSRCRRVLRRVSMMLTWLWSVTGATAFAAGASTAPTAERPNAARPDLDTHTPAPHQKQSSTTSLCRPWVPGFLKHSSSIPVSPVPRSFPSLTRWRLQIQDAARHRTRDDHRPRPACHANDGFAENRLYIQARGHLERLFGPHGRQGLVAVLPWSVGFRLDEQPQPGARDGRLGFVEAGFHLSGPLTSPLAKRNQWRWSAGIDFVIRSDHFADLSHGRRTSLVGSAGVGIQF